MPYSTESGAQVWSEKVGYWQNQLLAIAETVNSAGLSAALVMAAEQSPALAEYLRWEEAALHALVSEPSKNALLTTRLLDDHAEIEWRTRTISGDTNVSLSLNGWLEALFDHFEAIETGIISQMTQRQSRQGST